MKVAKLLLIPLAVLFLSGGIALAAEKKEVKDGADLGHDYRTFYTGKGVEYGKIGDSYTAELVMYLAGNQFMVMEELVGDFQRKHPFIKTIYVETIPPGQILKGQILNRARSTTRTRPGIPTCSPASITAT